MKINEMFPSPYLKSGDFEEEEVKVLTIKGIELEELTSKEGEKQTKPVISFREKDVKPLVCNITNAKIIAGLYGEDSDEWLGKRISLFVTQVDSFGKQVDAIRVRAKIPPKAAAAAKPETPAQKAEDEELPFDEAAARPRTEWTEDPDLEQTAPAATLGLKPGVSIPSKQGRPWYGLDKALFEKLANSRVVTDRRSFTAGGNGAKVAWDSLLAFALAHDFAVDDYGKVNQFQMAQAAWTGGFPDKMITGENVELAKAAIVRYYTDKENAA